VRRPAPGLLLLIAIFLLIAPLPFLAKAPLMIVCLTLALWSIGTGNKY